MARAQPNPAVKAPPRRTSRPLEGLRVLDLTNVLSGPFCCHQLAHLGAEVLKIEEPAHGDLARRLGADPALNARRMGVSFLAQNAGKRSVTLDLKNPRGKALLRRFVERSDVLVENFRPGVMERLGLGSAHLLTLNPRLIYCAISGFGQDGPLRDLPAYDQIIQGLSGVMAITGAPDTAPYRVGYPLCDTIGGLTAAMAICAALNARTAEGGGVAIDVSMLEATLATMGWVVSNWMVAGQRPAAHGNENPTSAPSGAFRAADGLLNIAANKDEHWTLLCRAIGRTDLLERPEYATREDRKARREALKATLEATLAERPVAHWVAALGAVGVPAGAVLTPEAALASPQVADRGFFETFAAPDGVGRDLTLARVGLKIDGATPAVDTPPPTLGRDTDAVLADVLGLSADEIAAARAEGAL